MDSTKEIPNTMIASLSLWKGLVVPSSKINLTSKGWEVDYYYFNSFPEKNIRLVLSSSTAGKELLFEIKRKICAH